MINNVKATCNLHLFKYITFSGLSNFTFDPKTLSHTMVIPNETITMDGHKHTSMTLNDERITGDETIVTLVG